MSENIQVTGSPTVYKATVHEGHRISAVECALELIHAHASSGCSIASFNTHMDSLSEYADKIQAAVSKK